jgi:hypothetical protein
MESTDSHTARNDKEAAMATKLVKPRRLALVGLAALAVLSLGVLPSALAQDIVVSSAEPAEAEQGTVNLDVTINGKGFSKGAQALFLVTGTENPGGIVVHRTTYVNSVKLVANIDVALDAVVGSFDIQVTSKGRTGKGLDCFTVKVHPENPSGPSPVAADFRDAEGDGVMSDGLGPQLLPACQPFDYVDVDDPCNPGVSTVSNTMQGYFLRTVSNLVPTAVDRRLVLDFSHPYGNYSCPNLDQQLMDEATSGPYEVLPPLNTDPCIDWVEVRLVADGTFQPGVASTTVNMLIDTPVLKAGKGKKAQPYTQWDARFILNSVNPLTLSYGPSGEAIIGANGDDFRFELWTFDQQRGTFGEFIGFYWMPLQLTLQKRQ